MQKKYIFIFLFAFLFLLVLQPSYALCNGTLGKEKYAPLENPVVTFTCSAVNEKSQSYNILWWNGTAYIANHTGTTPATTGQAFFDTITIPDNSVWTNANVSLTGTNLESGDWFNVSGKSATQLYINNFLTTENSNNGVWIGEIFGIQFTVKNYLNKSISNAKCIVSLEDGNNVPILQKETTSVYGLVDTNFILDSAGFEEGREYLVKASCLCGAGNTTIGCFDTDGNSLQYLSDFTRHIFNINTTLLVNTVNDKSIYYLKNKLFVCANVTNNNGVRKEIKVNYNFRCSNDSSNSNTDRALYGFGEEIRGISAGTTQNQCYQFIIPEYEKLQAHNSTCYSATDVTIQRTYSELTYSTTSPFFTIISDELNLYPDWERINNTYYSSIINLSKDDFLDFTSNIFGNLDLKFAGRRVDSILNTRDSKLNEGGVFATEFNNFTCRYCNNTPVNCNLEAVDDGFLELELRNVDMTSTGCYEVNVSFFKSQDESLQNISMYSDKQSNTLTNITSSLQNLTVSQGLAYEALEGIENKTGTFRLSVACPSSAVKNSIMTCGITYQIESGETQKEVDFTCYILDGTTKMSTINFNKMANTSVQTDYYEINVPSLATGEYKFQCEADYYNLGIRKDTFYDTFTVTELSSSTEPVTTGITAELVEQPTITEEKVFKQGLAGKIEWIKENKKYLIYVIPPLLIICCYIYYKRKYGEEEVE